MIYDTDNPAISVDAVCPFSVCGGCTECRNATLVLRVARKDARENGVWLRYAGVLRRVCDVAVGEVVEVRSGILYAETFWVQIAPDVWCQVVRAPDPESAVAMLV